MYAFFLHPERDKSLLRRHPWVFSKAIAQKLALPDSLIEQEDIPADIREQLTQAAQAAQANSSSTQHQQHHQHQLSAGELCQVRDCHGKFLAWCHFSPYSQISLRVISFDLSAKIDYAFFKQCLKTAIDKRKGLKAKGNDGIRLVAAEGDYMPSLIVDQYNQVLSFAITSWGMEANYEHLVRALHELMPDCYIYERSDGKTRAKEKLPLRRGAVDYTKPLTTVNLCDDNGTPKKSCPQVTAIPQIQTGTTATACTITGTDTADNTITAASANTVTTAGTNTAAAADTTASAATAQNATSSTSVTLSDLPYIDVAQAIPQTLYVKENDLVSIPIDVRDGHKTGGYLDQRQSRLHCYQLCRDFKAEHSKGPTVLNCFSYTGGFGLLALKGGAAQVFNIDVSAHALDAAKQGVVWNHLDPGRCKFIKKDVFAYLREEVQKGTKFDIVILDPPKFAESKSTLVTACRGYQDINRLGMQLVSAGGHLLTFSCSGLMTIELMQKILADAALDAHVNAQIVATLRQDQDHMVALPCPESFYLKGFDLLIS